MALLDQMLSHAGETKVPVFARERYGFRGRVGASAEFRRISAIPRRDPAVAGQDFDGESLCVPGGKMHLWPIQRAALAEIARVGGGFFPIGVGEGKAAISLLAPVVLHAERPILFVPASLREQTLRVVIPMLSKHFRFHPGLRVIGYSELSLEKNADMLEEINPDLIILDECHRVKRKQAGRTRRLVRWFRAHPQTMCVAMSGTIAQRSITDWAHIAEWCLRDAAPVPCHFRELTEWSMALDADVPDEKRFAPGVLEEFCQPGDNVRQGFRRRLVETPGVVASAENKLGVSLRIYSLSFPLPAVVNKAIARMRATWETPGGESFAEAVDLWRHVRELALGFYYKWDPAPPAGWLAARKAWKAFVRETLKTNRRGLDTELQVWLECEKQNMVEEWKAWRDVKDTFKAVTVPVWIDDFAVRRCLKWLFERTEDDRGIVWVEHRTFGQRIEETSGGEYQYFGAGDDYILDCQDSAIVASIVAHGEGKNLQRFSRNLITAPPASGKTWEQLIGRTHREGQLTDEVTVEVFSHVEELAESFEKARSDARYLEDTYGGRQRLNYADIVFS